MYRDQDRDYPMHVCLVINAAEKSAGYMLPFEIDEPLLDQINDRLYKRTDFAWFEYIIFDKRDGAQTVIRQDKLLADFGYSNDDIMVVVANPLATFEISGKKHTIRLYEKRAVDLMQKCVRFPDNFELTTLYDVSIPRYELMANYYSQGTHHVLKLKPIENDLEDEPEPPEELELIVFLYGTNYLSAAYRYLVDKDALVVPFVKSKMAEMVKYTFMVAHYNHTIELDCNLKMADLDPCVVMAIPIIDLEFQLDERTVKLERRFLFDNTALSMLDVACEEFEVDPNEYRLLLNDDAVMSHWTMFDFASDTIHELKFVLEKL